MDPDAILTRGVEITDWPFEKFDRADQCARNLIENVRTWNQAGHVTAEYVARDAYTIAAVVHVAEPAPIRQMSLEMGEVIHNIRSGLDAFAWELSGLGNATNTQRKDVYFPIANDEPAWGDAASRLTSIDPVLVRRLRHVQPFEQAKIGSTSPLVDGLSRIGKWSNVDKHRGIVPTAAIVKGLSSSLKIRVDHAGQGNVGWDQRAPATETVEAELVDGFEYMKMVSGRPVTILSDTTIQLSWAWQIRDPQVGGNFPLEIMLGLPGHARALVEYVCSGKWANLSDAR